MYFGYYGSSFTTLMGNYYESNRIYRLLIGDDGRFYFENDPAKLGVKNTFTVVTSANDGNNSLLYRSFVATEANVGDIYYYLYTGTDYTNKELHFYHQPNKFYVITRSDTGDYYPKVFGAVSGSYEDKNSDGNYSLHLFNERIYTGGFYGGTGGTEYVVVTAVIKTDDGESIRKFKIKVTG
jgi:hypothetical protein